MILKSLHKHMTYSDTNFNNKTILITGGAGFIGATLICELIQKSSCEVVNVDCLTYAGNLDSLMSIEKSDRYFF